MITQMLRNSLNKQRSELNYPLKELQKVFDQAKHDVEITALLA
jgi:hypothetical protein